MTFIACLYRNTGRNTWVTLMENTAEAVQAYMDTHEDSAITHVIVGQHGRSSASMTDVCTYTQVLYTVRQERRIVSTVERV